MSKRLLSVLGFTTFKYLEVVLTAATTFYLANKIGPTEIGKSINFYLFITYSGYLVLGVNSALIKNYFLFKVESESVQFLGINLQFVFLACVVTTLLSSLFFGFPISIPTAIVSMSILCKSYFSALFRVWDKIWVVNVSNLTSLLILSLGTYLIVTDWYSYMLMWALSGFLGTLIYICLLGKRNLVQIARSALLIHNKISYRFNLLSGLKLAGIGLALTLVLSWDRILLNFGVYNISDLGSYQLAEQITMGVFVLVTSVIFYFTPVWIEKLRSNNTFRIKYIRCLKIYIAFAPIISAFVYAIWQFVLREYFPEYVKVSELIFTTMFIKLLAISWSSLNLVYISMNLEKEFMRSLHLLIGLVLGSIALCSFVDIPLSGVPRLILILLFIEVLFRYFHLKSRRFDSDLHT